MKLAILQSIPKHPRRAVRTDSFAKFQILCGMIEQESYLAAHAACHATMNGIARTIALDTDLSDPDALRQHADRIFDEAPFDALVIPGLTDFDLQKDICRIVERHADSPTRVFFDPPRSIDIDDLVDRQKDLPEFAAFAWPWIATLTPGRRSMEWLPPSCLIAPLALGCATFLKGVHDIENIESGDEAFLDEHRVEVICVKKNGRRPVLGRFRETPSHEPVHEDFNQFVEIPGFKRLDPDGPEPRDVDEAAVEMRLRREIDFRCMDIIRQYGKNDRSLWAALVRTVTSVLMDARQRRDIVKFHVRCDEETASWGTPTIPVVEIIIEYPKRVKGIRFRMNNKPAR